jgi:hypothetical protein
MSKGHSKPKSKLTPEQSLLQPKKLEEKKIFEASPKTILIHPKQLWWQSGTFIGVNSVLGVVAFFIALYTLRPIVAVSPSSVLDPSEAFSVRFVLSNGGQLEMQRIQVFCVDNQCHQ